VVLLLATVGLLVALLIDQGEGPALDSLAPATDAGKTSERQAVTAARPEEEESRTVSSGFGEPTARSAGAPGVRAMIERHWMKREDQQLSSAYADLSPRFRVDPAVGSESAWVARQKANPLQDVFVRVRPQKVKERTAQAEVARLRTQTQFGCTEWFGYYTLIRSGGRWQIDSQSLSEGPC
jgi:hypothetical protein